MQVRFCAIVTLLILCSDLRAQFAAPIRDSVHSAILREQRDIVITLPASYANDTARYDVWYVLDGEWDGPLFTQIFSYMVNMKFAPPAILVAVPNRYVNGFNLRDRDLTPTKFPDVDSSGGAANYLAFFEKELIPHIHKKYRTNGENGLFGGSFGGLFTIYALLEKPSLFHFYATADPALHNDNRQIPQLAAKRLPAMQFSNTVLSIGGRSEKVSYHQMARAMMDSVLAVAAPAGLRWHSALYPDEVHSSTPFKSIYDGLKFSYLGYYVRSARCYPNGGIVLKDKPVKLYIPTDYSDIRYTIDGATPARSSEKLDDHLLVSEPEKLKLYSFSPSGRWDHPIPVNLRPGGYLSPKPRKTKLDPARRLSGNFKDNAAEVMDGWVQIDKDGYYVLQCTPPVGTKLFLNDSLLLQADAENANLRQAIILPLRSGNYTLRVEHPDKRARHTPLHFGMYYSKNGRDDWWTNPVVTW
ncbi:MAG: chitobiase/beta-hexosaminidase C-terminal domain-containing protein [Dyadobacter sp.]|uniref:alpha/beta hydrolase-fold protein n=1 Tax=Dyadobacter sp. TaxID=1914288 RepID=UPI001B122E20|nr:alpha/beta hydrolase-fold protein [Dyadobacter sp.]MBO9616538.1 chitobiase/beta-hexosaminidase C-terminal domain-containing protein [Dyadobacter sp.]